MTEEPVHDPVEPQQPEQPVMTDASSPAEVPDDVDAVESRAFLDAVRRAAGWRVSPREVATAVEAIADAGQTPTPELVARVAAAGRGERSQRQRRHADLWRRLGAQLAVRGLESDPEAQRAFVGRARAIAKVSSDALVLQVALQVAANDGPLNPRVVGQVTEWLVNHAGLPLSEEAIRENVPQALEAIMEAQDTTRRETRGGRRTQHPGPPRRGPRESRGQRPAPRRRTR